MKTSGGVKNKAAATYALIIDGRRKKKAERTVEHEWRLPAAASRGVRVCDIEGRMSDGTVRTDGRRLAKGTAAA